MFKSTDMDPARKAGKKKALEDLRSMAMGEMKGGLEDAVKSKGMKKVTVGSDSQEGLEHGLKKAQDLVANPEKLADPANEDSIDDINPSKEATTLKEAHDETPEHQAEDEVQDTKDENEPENLHEHGFKHTPPGASDEHMGSDEDEINEHASKMDAHELDALIATLQKHRSEKA